MMTNDPEPVADILPRVLADIKKRVRPRPAPLGGSLRAALQDFLANRPAAFPPPPDCDDAPPSEGETESNDPADVPWD